MADYDASTVILSIFGGGGGLLAAGAFLRDYLKGRTLTDANRDAAINGVEINQSVLKNINDELRRHSDRISELEAKVAELTTKLANVRMIAIDCYALANDCECEGKTLLLNHIKQIIQDS